MPVYAYKGVNQAGRSAKGTISAESPRAARTQMRGQGIFLTEIAESAAGAAATETSAAESGPSFNLDFQLTAPLALLYDIGLHVLQPCKNCETESARRPTDADGAALSSCSLYGAKGGTRTPTPSRALDPKSSAYTNFATFALHVHYAVLGPVLNHHNNIAFRSISKVIRRLPKHP